MRLQRAAEVWRETWHGDQGEELRITCADGACLAEISVPAPLTQRQIRWHVEISLQPRDHRGLPCGPPVFVQREAVLLLPQYGGQRCAGRFWLPAGLSPATLQGCYYRLLGPAETVAAEPPESAD